LDAEDESVRHASEKAFKEELLWASHLAIGAIIVPCPNWKCENYAGNCKRHVKAMPRLNFWINIPLTNAKGREDDHESPWAVWNKFRLLCGQTSNSLGILLELSPMLPVARSEIERWIAEPVKAVLIPTNIFLTNAKGFPVLSAAHQSILIEFFQKDIQFILAGKARHDYGLNPYLMYLQHLVKQIPPPSTKDEFERSFYDYLQSPLQPLMDHLESQMYETFEKDPVKYARYEEAIQLALSETPHDKTSVVMVVGAGRGPLVRATIRAADRANRRVKVYAVEKNPNAVITLRNLHNMLRWGDAVTIVRTDMRFWDAPELADILVSELLGSWGDNELSPECLDGAEKFLKPETGISIPYEYTSFVQPISTPKLWEDCKGFDETKYMETMYVVKLHRFYSFDISKPVFTFAHPSWKKGLDPFTRREHFIVENGKKGAPKLLNGAIDNSKHTNVSFKSNLTGLLHGFAGYFEAKLYNDVMISINPETFSEGMFSWFPIYIPLHQPVQVEKGDTITISFWRQSNHSQVWYEWALTSPQTSTIHNLNGESAPIKLTSES